MKHLTAFTNRIAIATAVSKRTFIKVNIILAACFVLATSCHKERDSQPVPQTEEQVTIASTAPLDPAMEPGNRKNPYDKAGLLHNILLEATQAYIDRTQDTSRGGIHEFVAQQFQAETGTDPRPYIAKVNPEIDYTIAAGQGAMVIRSFTISKPVTDYLDALWELLNAVQEANFPELKAKITSLEDRILADRTISEDERRLLLSTTSVARYSSAYWISWAVSQGEGKTQMRMNPFLFLQAAMKAGLADAAALVVGHMLKLPMDVTTEMSAAVSSIVYSNLMSR